MNSVDSTEFAAKNCNKLLYSNQLSVVYDQHHKNTGNTEDL